MIGRACRRRGYGCVLTARLSDSAALQHLCWDAGMLAMLGCWDACDVYPRTCASKGACLVKYHRWFALPADAPHNPFFRLPLGLKSVFRVLRFRLGCYENLPFVLARNDRDRRAPRAERLCHHCTPGALGMSTMWCLSVLPPGPLARLSRTTLRVAGWVPSIPCQTEADDGDVSTASRTDS